MDGKNHIEKILESFKNPEMQHILNLKVFKAGDVVFREGDKTSEFYLIESGSVGVFKLADSDTGKEKQLALLGRGNFFGEGVLFDDELRSATVKSLSDSRIWAVQKQDLLQLLKEDTTLGLSFLLNILQVTNERLQNMNRQMVLLYEIGRIIAKDKKDFSYLCAEVLKKIIEATGCELGVIFVRDAFSNAFSMKAASDRAFNDLDESLIKELGQLIWSLKDNSDFIISGENLIAGVKDMDGKLSGAVILKATKIWPEEKQRLVAIVAEQLGNTFDEIVSFSDKNSKEKLGRKYIGL